MILKKNILGQREELPCVSVIVTVYNMEKYVGECISSITQQTLRNIEIICIDDGSTDASGKILDDWAEKDSRIVVVHQPNRELVNARKKGVSLARAKYVGFVDADDWIDCDMYATLHELMETNGVDFVSSGLYAGNGKERLDYLKEGIYEKSGLVEFFSKMIYHPEIQSYGMYPNTVNKLYVTDRLRKTQKGIDEKIRNKEDDALVFSYLIECQKVQIVHRSFYHVRRVQSSHARREDMRALERINAYYLFLNNIFEQSPYARQLIPQLDIQLAHTVVAVCLNRSFGLSIDCHMCISFPFQKINGRKVVIYGAGAYGGRLIQNIKKANRKKYKDIDIVAVLDRKEGIEVEGYVSESVVALDKKKFDYIIIAIQDKTASDDVYNLLLENRIPPDQIIKDIPAYSY